MASDTHTGTLYCFFFLLPFKGLFIASFICYGRIISYNVVFNFSVFFLKNN